MTALALDANLGPVPPRTLGPVLAGLDLESLRRYPDAAPLEAALGARFGIESERVLVTAGADDAIDRVCRAHLGPGRTTVLPSPSFDMLEHFTRLAGGSVVPVPWPDGDFPTDAVIGAIGPETGIVAIVSPNNPTGAVATADDLRRVAGALPPGAAVLLDHAYVEYAACDLTPAALDLPAVIVVRTLSKAWGLAGCRIGYALGSDSAIESLRESGAPYPVAAPSLAVALARLAGGEADMRAHVLAVRVERAALVARLAALGLEASPSEGNFVLARCGARAAPLASGLAARGVRVRTFAGRPGLETAIRISLPGEPSAFSRLLAALESALEPEAGS